MQVESTLAGCLWGWRGWPMKCLLWKNMFVKAIETWNIWCALVLMNLHNPMEYPLSIIWICASTLVQLDSWQHQSSIGFLISWIIQAWEERNESLLWFDAFFAGWRTHGLASPMMGPLVRSWLISHLTSSIYHWPGIQTGSRVVFASESLTIGGPSF